MTRLLTWPCPINPPLPDYVGPHVPRLLINREKAGELTPEMAAVGYTKGFNFGEDNYRCVLACTANLPNLVAGRRHIVPTTPQPCVSRAQRCRVTLQWAGRGGCAARLCTKRRPLTACMGLHLPASC